jgi:hypothetical protein
MPYLIVWTVFQSGVAQWLRRCATSRKVAGSIPGVAGVFPVASDSSMFPGVDWASKNEYQVNPGGKGGLCVRLKTYHLHVPMSRNLGALTSWNPVGLFRPVMGRLYLLPCCNIRHNKLPICPTSTFWLRNFEGFYRDVIEDSGVGCDEASLGKRFSTFRWNLLPSYRSVHGFWSSDDDSDKFPMSVAAYLATPSRLSDDGFTLLTTHLWQDGGATLVGYNSGGDAV